MTKGVNGQVTVESGCVIITRKGMLGALSRNADAKIPINNLSYIQLVRPMVENGFINFVMAGSPQVNNLKQAMSDSTCVIVSSFQYKHFVKLKAEIEKIMSAPTIENAPAHSDADVLAQLEKLSELKNKGIISEDEFLAKKTDLLGRL